MVNRNTPHLFPVISLLNKQFLPAAFTSHRAFFAAGSKSAKLLKIKRLSLARDLPLNRTKCRNFFIYWDEQKFVKYVPASRVNAARSSRRQGGRAPFGVFLCGIFSSSINGLLSLTCRQGAFLCKIFQVKKMRDADASASDAEDATRCTDAYNEAWRQLPSRYLEAIRRRAAFAHAIPGQGWAPRPFHGSSTTRSAGSRTNTFVPSPGALSMARVPP